MDLDLGDHVQVSSDRGTVWVHAEDGSTVGRFSKRFGMDVHNTAAAQLEGRPQCLHCTHRPASEGDWRRFCDLMFEHHGIAVPRDATRFGA